LRKVKKKTVFRNQTLVLFTFRSMSRIDGEPVGKIAENEVCMSVFLTIWHCNLSKTHSFRLFFGDFAHWGAMFIEKVYSS